jgi:hypothetical protein
MFSHSDYYADMLEPSVTLRIGPGIDDLFPFSQTKLEADKAAIETFCRSLPHLDDGGSWKLYMTYVGFNGMSAKVLIALGGYLGIWRAHPPPESPQLWLDDNYPVILSGTLTGRAAGAEGVPKPSAGDLVVVGSVPCAECGRPMGPWDSPMHLLVAAEPYEDTCIECAAGLGKTAGASVIRRPSSPARGPIGHARRR